MKKIISILIIISNLFICANAAEIAVLCYHDVSDNPLNFSQYSISAQEFEDDVQYFLSQNYSFLKPCEMWYAQGDKNIVLTSDDGYENFYTYIFPILKKYDVKAAVYVIGSMIDKTDYLKSWQIKEMHDSGLVEIGNHTHIMHRRSRSVLESWYNNFKMLNEVFYDIERCSLEIEKITGKKTESIAYPYGLYTFNLNDTTRNKMGFTTSFSTEEGIVTDKTDFLSPMKRIYRCFGDTPQKIENIINSYK